MQPKKVLVVDDAKLMHKMFATMLRPLPLLYALDGFQALERLADEPGVDLILLDINMPNMNGLEFLSRLKADRALSGIAVIVISTEGKEDDAERGLAAGAQAYIKKPFQAEQIWQAIADLPAGPTP